MSWDRGYCGQRHGEPAGICPVFSVSSGNQKIPAGTEALPCFSPIISSYLQSSGKQHHLWKVLRKNPGQNARWFCSGSTGSTVRGGFLISKLPENRYCFFPGTE